MPKLVNKESIYCKYGKGENNAEPMRWLNTNSLITISYSNFTIRVYNELNTFSLVY